MSGDVFLLHHSSSLSFSQYLRLAKDQGMNQSRMTVSMTTADIINLFPQRIFLSLSSSDLAVHRSHTFTMIEIEIRQTACNRNLQPNHHIKERLHCETKVHYVLRVRVVSNSINRLTLQVLFLLPFSTPLREKIMIQ